MTFAGGDGVDSRRNLLHGGNGTGGDVEADGKNTGGLTGLTISDCGNLVMPISPSCPVKVRLWRLDSLIGPLVGWDNSG